MKRFGFRRVITGVMLVASMALSACMGSSYQEAEANAVKVEKLVLPSGISGADVTVWVTYTYALDQFGRRMTQPWTNSKTGEVEHLPVMANVDIKHDARTPGALQLTSAMLPGVIEVGGNLLLQEHCFNNGGCGKGKSTPPVTIVNTNQNAAGAEANAAVRATRPSDGGSSGSGGSCDWCY